jgi:hypothetical protein
MSPLKMYSRAGFWGAEDNITEDEMIRLSLRQKR